MQWFCCCSGKCFAVCVLIAVVTQGLAYVTEPSPGSWRVAAAAGTCLFIQWVAFVPASMWQTEKFFDAIGSLTYISVTVSTLVASKLTGEGPSLRQMALSGCVLIWAVRLGSFLIVRIHHAGKDGRFDEIKPNIPRWFVVWNIQGIWTFLTAMPVFVLNAVHDENPFNVGDYFGFAIWLMGFLFEVVADRQKTTFNADPQNKGKWIDVGLWRYSRHPNYFGEVVLWVGATVVACSAFTRPGQWVCIISPFFVAFLLTKVSGLPLIEPRADEKWGMLVEYQIYKAKTSVIIPMSHRKVDVEVAKRVADAAESTKALLASEA